MRAAAEARRRMAKSLLERLRLKQAAERALDTAALKWSAAGLLHRSVAAFLIGFAVASARTGNSAPLFSVIVGAATATLPLAYVRRKAGARVRAFEEQFPDFL